MRAGGGGGARGTGGEFSYCIQVCTQILTDPGSTTVVDGNDRLATLAFVIFKIATLYGHSTYLYYIEYTSTCEGKGLSSSTTLLFTRSHPVALIVPRSLESIGSSGDGLWGSGTTKCDLGFYEIALGRTPLVGTPEFAGNWEKRFCTCRRVGAILRGTCIGSAFEIASSWEKIYPFCRVVIFQHKSSKKKTSGRQAESRFHRNCVLEYNRFEYKRTTYVERSY